MIIAVNTRLLIKDKLEGIGLFTYELLKRITINHPEHTFVFIFDRKYDQEFIFSDNIIPIILPPQARHPVLWYIYFEYSIPHILKKYNADVFLSTDGWVCLRTKIKTLNVIHDLHYERHPEFLPYLVRKYLQYFFPKFIQKSNRLCTVSEFSKREIISTYKLSADMVDVVYNATRTDFIPTSVTNQREIKIKYTGGKDYFLFIGPIHPRKNPENLIKAFIKFKKSTNSDLMLVMIGNTMWKNKDISKATRTNNYSSDIIYTGRVSSNELHLILGAAFCLTYVSFYEGFGIPILEAMSCRVPVIASQTSSMPEVGGNAVFYIDPFSVDSISEAMIKIYESPEIRKNLVENGNAQVEKFSWDSSAEMLWNSIISTIDA